MSVNTRQYNELSLPKFSDSSKQVAFRFIRELGEYFSLRNNPEKTAPSFSLPLDLGSICEAMDVDDLWLTQIVWRF